MILDLIQMFFPRYYARVWNEEFIKSMEQTRRELYLEFPHGKDLIDKRVEEAYERWLK